MNLGLEGQLLWKERELIYPNYFAEQRYSYPHCFTLERWTTGIKCGSQSPCWLSDPSLLVVILLHPALCPGKVICRDWFNMLPSLWLVVGLHPVGAWEGRCVRLLKLAVYLNSRSLLLSSWCLLPSTFSSCSGPCELRDDRSSTTAGPMLLRIFCGFHTPIHTFVVSPFVNKTLNKWF